MATCLKVTTCGWSGDSLCSASRERIRVKLGLGFLGLARVLKTDREKGSLSARDLWQIKWSVQSSASKRRVRVRLGFGFYVKLRLGAGQRGRGPACLEPVVNRRWFIGVL